MTGYDAQLKELQEKIARFRQLSAMLKELRSQRDDFAKRVRELETIKSDEQADVDRLEGRSLAALFYSITGKRDELLSKERQEACAAAVKHEAAVKELRDIEEDIRRYAQEYGDLRGCENAYQAALYEKRMALKAAGGKHAEEILQLEERCGVLRGHKKELSEAISAGNSARSTAESILQSLNSAKNWGTYDVIGGGLVADMAKHSHLNAAQASVERLQSQLRRFKTELADVRVRADMQVNVDGFLRFADYFFDGLAADLTVLNRISRSQSEVQSAKGRIDSILSRLNTMLRTVERELEKEKKKLDDLVLDAQFSVTGMEENK